MFSITKKRLAAAMASAVIAVGLTACGSSDDGGGTAASSSTGVKKVTIGYVDQMHAGAMQQRWYNYFSAAADRLGWDVRLQDAKGNPSLGNTQAVNFANQGVDAIVVSCLDTALMRPAIRAANRKKIPIVNLGCPTPEPEAWDAVYAEDEAALSRTLADYVVKQAGGKGQVGVLYDTQLLAGRTRFDVFKEELAKSETKIVGSQVIDLTNVDAASRKAASAFLNANPDLTSIISVYDYFAPPSASAIKAAGKADKVSVYAYYADSFNLPIMLAKGSPLRALVDGPVEQVALVVVDQLLAHFQEGKPLDRHAADNLDVKYEIFTQDKHPEYTKGYVTPYPVQTYLDPLVAKWQKAYGLK